MQRPVLSGVLLLLSVAPAQHDTAKKPEGIRWLHALDAVRPTGEARDERPVILYFTFDT